MTEKPIEQFLNTAKSLENHEKAAELILKVVDSSNIYSFSDLLELPLISSMENQPNYRKYFDLLKLFSYGTYQDYAVNKSKFPDLTENSLMKLRHLSIISLASKCRTIPYSTLSNSLDVNNIRELEDLIIEAFYSDIIKGKLDQANNQLEIDFAIGRDVTDEQINEIVNTLAAWCRNCDIALQTIETQIKQANSHKQNNIDLQANIDAEVANLKKSIMLQSQEVESMNTSGSKDSNKKSSKLKSSKIASGKSFK